MWALAIMFCILVLLTFGTTMSPLLFTIGAVASLFCLYILVVGKVAFYYLKRSLHYSTIVIETMSKEGIIPWDAVKKCDYYTTLHDKWVYWLPFYATVERRVKTE